MSADSPRHTRSGGPLIVPPQPPSDRTIIDAVSGFINDVKLTSTVTDSKDTIQWARFETADINEPTPEGDNNEISPLLLILGYGSGVQVWLIPPSGEAQEVLSWRQGTVRVLRILPTPQSGDSFASKRPMIALCDSASPGPTFCSLSFISIRGGEQVKSIKFKNPILDVLANKRSVVVSFSERFAVFDAGTLEDRMAVTTCYPCPCPLGGSSPVNPLALGDRWLAYADKKINPTKRSSGGCEGEGVASYTATVLHAAKSLGKGLRGLGESVAHSLGGARGASPPRLDQHQPGVLTVIDIEGNNEEDSQDGGEPYDPIIAHFIAHSDAIIALAFDSSGLLLVTADRRGHDFHVFRINPHPGGSARAAAHHLYTLHRGDTTARVQDIAISSDSRWAAISTLRGTTHIFPISPYGGLGGVRTHTPPRVVNRLSRFQRSAGLPIAGTVLRPGSPVGDSMSGGAWFPNPRLPPHPPPATVPPLAQIRPTASLPTHTITRTSSGRQRLSSLSEDSNPSPLLARARFGPPPAAPAGSGRAAQLSLYLLPASGCLLHAALHPRPAASVPKDKICDESPIELDVEPIAQWPLQRPAAAADLLAPLPPNNPLLLTNSCRRFSSTCVSEEERWLSQVEIVTHAGPHRRLWMGPQFVFKTYNCTGSHSSLSEAEAVEVELAARSTPVNMPGARPLVPVLIDSGSASSLEQSPSDSFRRKSLLAESGRAASVCDVQLREDLAEAMKEDQGCCKEAVVATRAAVERCVDQLGTVVPGAPAELTDLADLADLTDRYTCSNDDEARFRPVVSAPAPIEVPPPTRPLPLHTCIPAQYAPPRPHHSPDEPLSLTENVVIPAALTQQKTDLVSKELVMTERENSLPKSKPVDIQPAPRVKKSPTPKLVSDYSSVSELKNAVVETEVITVQPLKSNDVFPEYDGAKDSFKVEAQAVVEIEEEKSISVKVTKDTKRQNNDNKEVRSINKDDVVETVKTVVKRERKKDECRDGEMKSGKAKDITAETKVTYDDLTDKKETDENIKSVVKKEKKNGDSFVKEIKSSKEEVLTIETKVTSKSFCEQETDENTKKVVKKEKKNDDRDVKEMKSSKEKYSTIETKVTNESVCKQETDESNTPVVKKEKKKGDSVVKGIKTSVEKDNVTEIKVTKDNNKKGTEEIYNKVLSNKKEVASIETKVPKVSKKDRVEKKIQDDKKERQEIKEKNDRDIQENKVTVTEVQTKLTDVVKKTKQDEYDESISAVENKIKQDKVSTVDTTKKSSKDKITGECMVTETGEDTKESKISKDNLDNYVITEEPTAATEKKRRDDKKYGNKNNLVKANDEFKKVEESSIAVTLKLPSKAEPNTLSDQVEIKTEEQAWDMLLNETLKADTVLATTSQIPENIEEPKAKPKRNRRHKKSVDETASKADDSFVEIHAIEQQTNTGDLVSISTSYDGAKYARQTYKTKARSAKSATPEKSIDWGCEATFDALTKVVKPEADDSDISVETSPSKQAEFFEDSFDTLQVRMKGVASETTSFITKESSHKTKKSKSLSPYLDSHRKLSSQMDRKDLIIIDSSKEDFPDIKITSATKNRKKARQVLEPKVEFLEQPPIPAARSWSSIASSKSKIPAEEKVEVITIEAENPNQEIEAFESFKIGTKPEISLQDKLAELCKRKDIMVAECDAPTDLTFVEEHHTLHDLPPLEPLDFALDDFRLEVMRDSLLEPKDANITSPICKINIDDILSSIKDTTSRVLESSTFNFVDMQKVPKKKERGFSVIENEKITTQEIDINVGKGVSDKDEMEKSSEDDTTPVVSTDSDDRKSAEATAAIPSRLTVKAKKSRRKKK